MNFLSGSKCNLWKFIPGLFKSGVGKKFLGKLHTRAMKKAIEGRYLARFLKI